MGGGAEDTLSSHYSPSDGQLSVDQYFPQAPPRKAEEETAIQDDELMGGSVADQNHIFSQSQAKLRRDRAYREVLKCYDDLQAGTEGLEELKTKIRSYSPGTWVEEVGGLKSSDYQVPQTTCLLLIGPKGSGKSSLVNKILRVFEDDKFAPDRAQISYSCRGGDGTCFLWEYMIPKDSNAFCLYDTRGLSDYHMENAEKIRLWMKKGVRHGKLLIRGSDGPLLRKQMKSKARSNLQQSTIKRTVNFVVFVVDGFSLLKSIEGTESEEADLITRSYNISYLSFNDDKPVVVMTHGDLLSIEERARVRVHLGELLGIHPAKQIFDIPDSSDQATELTVVEMLRYSLEHADRNLPRKKTLLSNKVTRASMFKAPCFSLIQLLGLAVIFFLALGSFWVIANHHQPRTTHSVVHGQPHTANSVHRDPLQTAHSHSVVDDQPQKTNSVHHRPRKVHHCRPKKALKVACDQSQMAFSAHRPRESETNPEELHIDWSKIRHMWLG